MLVARMHTHHEDNHDDEADAHHNGERQEVEIGVEWSAVVQEYGESDKRVNKIKHRPTCINT